jgi:hypothetical protein
MRRTECVGDEAMKSGGRAAARPGRGAVAALTLACMAVAAAGPSASAMSALSAAVAPAGAPSAAATPESSRGSLRAGSFAVSSPDGVEEFFIVSSLDPARGRIVVKRPTEVTVTLRVNAETRYRDEQGRALALASLRAGSTAYIAYRQDAGGGATARLVRLAPMTVEVLHQRYLNPILPPR